MKLKNVPAKPRKFSGLMAAVTLAVLVAVNIGHSREARRGDQPASRTASPKVAHRADRRTELYAKLDRIIPAVRMIAKGDPYAEALAEKFVRYAVPFYPVPDPQGTRIKGVKPRQAIYPERILKVVFVASDEVYLVPKRVESPFFYDPDMKALVCIDFGALHEEMGGVMFLHELVHWDGFMTGREKPRVDVLSDASVEGELFAYDVGTRAYDRITGGEFGRRISQAIASDTFSARVGHWPWREPTKAGNDFLMALWQDAPLSKEEENFRISLFIVPFALAQAKNDGERAEFYRHIRREFNAQDLRKGFP
jgi:hypothetical protein